MGYAQKITRSTLNIIIFSVVTALIGYALKIYLARNMSVENFGLFYAVLSLTSLMFLIKDVGLGPALTKHIPEFQHKKDYASMKDAIIFSYTFQIVVSVILASIVYFMLPYMSENFFRTSEAGPVLLIMLFEVVLSSTTIKFTLQGMQFMKSYALMEMLRLIFVLVSVVFLLSLGTPGVALSYVIGSVVVQIIFSMYIVIKFRQMKTIDETKTGGQRKKLLKFGSYFLFGSISGFLIAYTDTLILTALKTLEDVGLYQAAISTSQILWGVALAFSAVLMPVISEMWAKNEKEKVGKGVSFILKYMVILIVPCMLLMVSFSEIVLNILFGYRYIGGAASLQILAFGAIFYSLMTVYATALPSIGRPDVATKITLIIGLFNLVANIVLVTAVGIIGAAIATTAAYVIGFLLYHIRFRHLVSVGVGKADMVKSVAGAFVALGIVYAIKEILYIDVIMESVFAVVVAISVYTIFIIKTKVIEKTDIEILISSKLPVPGFLLRFFQRNSR